MSGRQAPGPGGAPEIQAWLHEVASAALLGTARRPVPDPPEPSDGRGLGVEVSPDGAARLLDQIAYAASVQARPPMRRAPAHVGAEDAGDEQDEPAEERRSAAPEPAVTLLRLLLERPPVPEGLARRLIVSWLQACDADGSRVPGEVLPPVLDLAIRDADVRAALGPVLGQVGRRLCRLNPAWLPALEAARASQGPQDLPSYEAWRELRLDEREVVLARLRQRDPAAGLAWLDACLADEPARVRARLVPCLADGLSAADEPLLESCLADRSSVVREAAYALLDGLPGSRRAERAAALLIPLVSIGGARGRQLLQVADPPAPDEQAKRDGHARPAGRGVDPSRAQVRRLVAAASLETLTQTTGWAPAAVVSLCDDDVAAGLAAAAVAEQRPDWAAVLLLRRWSEDLVRLLPSAQAHDAVARHLAEAARSGDAAVLRRLPEVLGAAPGRWPEAMARPVVEALAHPRTLPAAVRECLPVLLERLPRAALPWLERAGALRLGPGHAAALSEVRVALELRGTIARAFQ